MASAMVTVATTATFPLTRNMWCHETSRDLMWLQELVHNNAIGEEAIAAYAVMQLSISGIGILFPSSVSA